MFELRLSTHFQSPTVVKSSQAKIQPPPTKFPRRNRHMIKQPIIVSTKNRQKKYFKIEKIPQNSTEKLNTKILKRMRDGTSSENSHKDEHRTIDRSRGAALWRIPVLSGYMELEVRDEVRMQKSSPFPSHALALPCVFPLWPKSLGKWDRNPKKVLRNPWYYFLIPLCVLQLCNSFPTLLKASTQ